MEGVADDADTKALQQKLKALKSRLKAVQDELQGSEACLENWKGKFGPGSQFGAEETLSLENEVLFAAEIGSVELQRTFQGAKSLWGSRARMEGSAKAGEPVAVCGDASNSMVTYREYTATLFPCFKTALSGLDDWSHVWLIGGCPVEYATANTFSAAGMCSIPPGAPSSGVFAPSCPHGQSFHQIITEGFIKDYYEQHPELKDAPMLDPYTAYLTHPQCFDFAPGEQQSMVCILCKISSVDIDSLTIALHTMEEIPKGFVLLDLKVYHPQVESLTNLGLIKG